MKDVWLPGLNYCSVDFDDFFHLLLDFVLIQKIIISNTHLLECENPNSSHFKCVNSTLDSPKAWIFVVFTVRLLRKKLPQTVGGKTAKEEGQAAQEPCKKLAHLVKELNESSKNHLENHLRVS